MYDRTDAARVRPTRDAGMTLPELLISIVVLGVVLSVLMAGVSVTLKQGADTSGRLDVARWEQNLGMWLPDDLSSASTITISPTDSPCGSASCPGVGSLSGSSVIMLSWVENGRTTTVSYRYQPDGPDAYGLFRVACIGGACTSARVLSDLSPPVDGLGNPISWAPGDPVPTNIIEVDVPAAVGPVDENAEDADLRRVIVTVNGVATPDGQNRSSRVSLAASGATLGTLDPPTFTPPSFRPARSECGGPITLVVDRSGSIGADMPAVRAGVQQFVNLFDGTPTRLQIVDFASRSNALGAQAGEWNHYADMTVPGTADTINGLVGGLTSGGSTNWEDALFRTFNTDTGVSHANAGNPSAPMPELVVFFTDGMPTRDRELERSDSASTAMGVDLDPRFTRTASYSPPLYNISPRAWFRAEQVVARSDDVRIIGVGVGTEFGASRWMRRQNRVDGAIIDGWPTTAPTPHAKFLGNLVQGGDVTDLDDPADNSYVTTTWSAADGWGDLDATDVLVASDFTKFADALAEIALGECGGTLTVQTRLSSTGENAPFDLTYEVEDDFVTTSRVAKSGTFDLAVGGQAQRTVRLTPRATDLGAAGYGVAGWSCRARGLDLVAGTDFQYVDALDLSAGITLTVRANAAVSCTAQVAR
jgi:prepilin-type N-terminal cleavage/methylation domain-containing protein